MASRKRKQARSARRSAGKPAGSSQTATTPSRPQPSALNAPGGLPYDGASFNTQRLQGWSPALWSGDTVIGPQRDTLVARIRDLVRNDGWATSAVNRTVDNAVGVSFRPISKPDYRALRAISGNTAFDAQWAQEFGNAVDARWRLWANDTHRYNDAERMLTFGQQMSLAFRHLIVDGDALAVLPWLEDRMGYGGARYATCVQLIDPDRLSNPNVLMNTQQIRNGVEIDAMGAPIAYHIREAHQADWWSAADTVSWRRIPREDAAGRPIVCHMYDHQAASQHRGGAGILAPVIERLRMLTRYDGAELDAALVNALFAVYIESPYDHDGTADAFNAGPGTDQLETRLNMQAAWHQGRQVEANGLNPALLFPGESAKTVSAARPASGYRDFQRAVLNNVASGTGLSPQQLSNDWSETNYSSARGAMLEAWKTLSRRRQDFELGFCQPIRIAFLEEAMELDNLPLPRNAPDYALARGAYARAKWLGPGRGWIDPVAEKKGAILGMDAGLSTLEQECAINEGGDWEENLDQRAIEIAAFKARGLALPEWAERLEVQQTVQEPEP